MTGLVAPRLAMVHINRRALFVTAAIVWAVSCGGHSPASPTPVPTSSPQPAPEPPPSTVVHLTGTVRSYGGDPVPDADVAVSHTADGSNQQSTKSDSSGRYAFSVLTGGVTLSAHYPDRFASGDVRQIRLSGDAVQDLELMDAIPLNAGESVEAEVHVGPHNGFCRVFLESYDELQPCRTFYVRFDRAGTLSASLNWSGGSGLALAQ